MVAEFTNNIGDVALGEILQQTLLVQLEQQPFELISDARLRNLHADKRIWPRIVKL